MIIVHVKNTYPIYNEDLYEGVFCFPNMERLKEVFDTSNDFRIRIPNRDGDIETFTIENFDDLEIDIIGYNRMLPECVIMLKR